jgi:hypothetical protein
MTGGDRRKPLWASSLADQPRPDYDVIARILEEPEDDPHDPPPPQDQPPARWPMPVLGLAAVLGVIALLIALDGRGSLTIADVPSNWGEIPMTCHTARLEQDDRALEWFRCRATGGLTLPPGVYPSPESQWSSDITREPATESRIQISPDGEAEGWAAY